MLTVLLDIESFDENEIDMQIEPFSEIKEINAPNLYQKLMNLPKNKLEHFISTAKIELQNKLQAYVGKDIELPKTLKGLLDLAKKFKIDVKEIGFEIENEIQTIFKAIKNPLGVLKKESTPISTQDIMESLPKHIKNEKIVKENYHIQDNTNEKELKPKVNHLETFLNSSNEKIKTKEIIKEKPQNNTDQKEFNPRVNNLETLLSSRDKKTKIKEPTKEKYSFFGKSIKQKEKNLITKNELIALNKNNTHRKEFKPKLDNSETLLRNTDEKIQIKEIPKENFFIQDNLDQKKFNFNINNSETLLNPDHKKIKEKELKETSKKEISIETKVDTKPSEITESKTGVANIIKAGSIEYKANDAKIMVSHLSENVKEAIENYKSPFTRIKMVLNPAKLGELDVTLIQKSNGMQVNINSSQNTMQILMQNAGDLKQALSSVGLENASMNFSSQQEQKQQQQQEQGHKHYSNQLSEDNEDETTSLDIFISQYI